MNSTQRNSMRTRLFSYALSGDGSAATAKNLADALRSNGGKPVSDSSWDLLWISGGRVPFALYAALNERKIVNQIPKIESLHHKPALAGLVEPLKPRLNGETLGAIHPETINLSLERAKAEHLVNETPPGSWLLKPQGGARGEGIEVIRSVADLPAAGKWLVQRYIDNPFLINGRKTKLRCYLLITRLQPLEAWLYSNGIIKIAVEPYTNHPAQLGNGYIHNVAAQFQKTHANYRDEDCLVDFNGWHRTSGCQQSHPLLWQVIKGALATIMKALAPTAETIHRNHLGARHCCFELFGVDIMFDSDFKPWVLEFNRSPSMSSCHPINLTPRMQKSAVQTVVHEFFQFPAPPVEGGDCFEPLVLDDN